MATARAAAGSALATIQNTANMLSSVVNVAADSVNMLGGYVSKHRVMQDKRNIVELHIFEDRLVKETARTIQEENEILLEWVSKNPTRAEQFQNEIDILKNLLNPEPISKTE